VCEPAVSVIIPTRNRADLLGDAIRSVLHQSFEDFELLIVDGDSEDSTRELVASFSDPRIRYLHVENIGISHSLNSGLEKARGALIARLDSDDEWLPDMLTELTGVLSAHPDAGVAYAKARAMDSMRRNLNEHRGLPLWYPNDSFKSMLYGDVTCNIALLARRQCLERAGHFDTSLEVHEDWDLWLRVSRHCEFRFLDRVLARFRRHEENITGQQSRRYQANINKRIHVLDKAYSMPDLPASALEVKPLAYANTHIWMASDWLRSGQPRRALLEYREAWKTRRYGLGAFFSIAWGVAARELLWKTRWGRALVLKLTQVGR
jgi:glycosyltransferase involved in cell wall biosynthesis